MNTKTFKLTTNSEINFYDDGRSNIQEWDYRSCGPVRARVIDPICQRENDRKYIKEVEAYLNKNVCDTKANQVLNYMYTLDWVKDADKEDTDIEYSFTRYAIKFFGGREILHNNVADALNSINTYHHTRMSRKGKEVDATGVGSISKVDYYFKISENKFYTREKVIYKKDTSGSIYANRDALPHDFENKALERKEKREADIRAKEEEKREFENRMKWEEAKRIYFAYKDKYEKE